MADFAKLGVKIGITFQNIEFLKLALTHSSYINENPDRKIDSNERLEFLGDAVLGLIIADRLYREHPNSSEGELTRLRAALVCRDTLTRMARKIDLGDYLLLGIGEESGGGRNKSTNLAGAFESLIAAIYLDRGLDPAKDFIFGLFGSEINQQAQLGAGMDYKSKLQEKLQAQKQITPSYILIKTMGPEHNRLFMVEVRAGEETLGLGYGKSKKLAEMDAARTALSKKQ